MSLQRHLFYVSMYSHQISDMFIQTFMSIVLSGTSKFLASQPKISIDENEYRECGAYDCDFSNFTVHYECFMIQ